MSERDILSSGFHFVCLLNRKHTHSLINKKFQKDIQSMKTKVCHFI